MTATSFLNTVTLSEFTDLTERTWVKGPEMVKSNARQMYIFSDQAANTGDTRRFQEYDTETFASLKREGEDASVAQVSVGYSKDMTARRFAKEINITHEMRRYNKAEAVIAQLTS